MVNVAAIALAVVATASTAVSSTSAATNADAASVHLNVHKGYNNYKPPAFVYKFDPDYAAGVKGKIKVKYASTDADETRARVSAKLDFSGIDMDALKAFDGNCTEEVTEFQWHIHVNWGNEYDSASFADCGKAITGNHYDPLKACGPNSEFVDTDECKPKTPLYDCTPETYAADPLACEKGDLAGKFGNFYVDDYAYVHSAYIDEDYPTVGENTPTWNIILHAVCGKVTPRIACALGEQVA